MRQSLDRSTAWYARPLPLVGLVLGLALALTGAYAALQLASGGGTDQDPGGESSPSSSTSPAEDWKSAAEHFAVAYTDTSGGKQAWLARIKPLVGPSLAQGFSYTDLGNLPRESFDHVTGGRVEAGETPTRSAQLHYDGGLIVDITLGQVPTTGDWVVTTVTTHEDPTDSGPGDEV